MTLVTVLRIQDDAQGSDVSDFFAQLGRNNLAGADCTLQSLSFNY